MQIGLTFTPKVGALYLGMLEGSALSENLSYLISNGEMSTVIEIIRSFKQEYAGEILSMPESSPILNQIINNIEKDESLLKVLYHVNIYALSSALGKSKIDTIVSVLNKMHAVVVGVLLIMFNDELYYKITNLLSEEKKREILEIKNKTKLQQNQQHKFYG